MSLARKLLVDVHTHVYLPRYANLLRSRSHVPRILTDNSGNERLLILQDESSNGRPVGPQVLSLYFTKFSLLTLTTNSSTGTELKSLRLWTCMA
jgi:hypothetical protein